MCINAYTIVQKNMPIDEVHKDRIYGYSGIINEELILSFLNLPHLMLLPMKILGKPLFSGVVLNGEYHPRGVIPG